MNITTKNPKVGILFLSFDQAPLFTRMFGEAGINAVSYQNSMYLIEDEDQPRIVIIDRPMAIYRKPGNNFQFIETAAKKYGQANIIIVTASVNQSAAEFKEDGYTVILKPLSAKEWENLVEAVNKKIAALKPLKP